ncbi:COG4653 Predicted phage phi-C31 gp36 major capsid-like protein [uncultured Caudovirales phage]|uniref:COG4653 Predicted phage phi-C31 gp36 major capsid-like protein n=1 Tax=uncultured Caudovirales phage TaxID=2100421 RepID=A0A6J5MLU3_9CAUD|nr:COG4653 Predicted phage phi-C31 gp36 major capsid-like protein [uncultured Caudovirales phage]
MNNEILDIIVDSIIKQNKDNHFLHEELSHLRQNFHEEFSHFRHEFDKFQTQIKQPKPVKESKKPKKYLKQLMDFIRCGEINPNYNKNSFETKDLTETGGNSGNFLIPNTILNEIFTLNHTEIRPSWSLRNYAKIENVKGNNFSILYSNDSGYSATFVSELANRVPTATGLIDSIKLSLVELYAQPRISINLLHDSVINLENFILQKIEESITVAEEQAFLYGTQLGILGLLNDTRITQFTSLNIQNIINADLENLFYSLDIQYINDKDTKWFMNQFTFKRLSQLSQDNQFIKLDTFFNSTLYGIPIVINPFMQSYNVTGNIPIFIGNLKNYRIFDLPEVTFIKDNITEKQWMKFYLSKRLNSVVTNPNAFKILKIK